MSKYHGYTTSSYLTKTEPIVEKPDQPIVYITPTALKKLETYIGLCKYEISGLGTVEQIGKNIRVTDIFLFKQTVSSASTDLDIGSISDFMVECINKGIDTSKLKCWWHSHVDFSTFWSSTDTATMERFNNDWMVSIVGNKKREYLTRLDVYNPFRISIDKLSLQQESEADPKFIEEIREEINEKCVVQQTRLYGYGISGTDWLNSSDYQPKPYIYGETPKPQRTKWSRYLDGTYDDLDDSLAEPVIKRPTK